MTSEKLYSILCKQAIDSDEIDLVVHEFGQLQKENVKLQHRCEALIDVIGGVLIDIGNKWEE